MIIKENEKIIEMRAYVSLSYKAKKYLYPEYIAQKSFPLLLNSEEHSENDPCNLHSLIGYTIKRMIEEGYNRKQIKKTLGLSDNAPNKTKLKGYGWRQYYASLGQRIPDCDWEYKYNLQLNENWVYRKHGAISLQIMKGTYL